MEKRPEARRDTSSTSFPRCSPPPRSVSTAASVVGMVEVWPLLAVLRRSSAPRRTFDASVDPMLRPERRAQLAHGRAFPRLDRRRGWDEDGYRWSRCEIEQLELPVETLCGCSHLKEPCEARL